MHPTNSQQRRPMDITHLYRRNMMSQILYANREIAPHPIAIHTNNNHVKIASEGLQTNSDQFEFIDNRSSVEKELDRLADLENVRSFITYECLMPQYYKLFIKSGFVSMDKIRNGLTQQSLDDMHIKPPWERSIILLKASRIQTQSQSHEQFLKSMEKSSKSMSNSNINEEQKESSAMSTLSV